MILLSGGDGTTSHIEKDHKKRMTDETIVTPQVMSIIASVMSLLSLVVSSLHCAFACNNPNGTFRLRFGSQSTVANDTITTRQ